MKKELKKGVSLIVLLITIVVILVLVTTTIGQVGNSFNDIKMSNFVHGVESVQEALNAYYISNNGLPVEDRRSI